MGFLSFGNWDEDEVGMNSEVWCSRMRGECVDSDLYRLGRCDLCDWNEMREERRPRRGVEIGEHTKKKRTRLREVGNGLD